MKTKKIVAVRFDDGTERKVTTLYLSRYLKARQREVQDYIRRHPRMQEMVEAQQKEFRDYEKHEMSDEMRDKARLPRKTKGLTKARILAFKNNYAANEGSKDDRAWGWQEAAHRHFGISTKTIRKILRS